MKADELEQAEAAFSLAIECRQRRGQGRAPGAADGTDTSMHAAHHRERGKVRQLLRDFDGARQERSGSGIADQLHTSVYVERGVSRSLALDTPQD